MFSIHVPLLLCVKISCYRRYDPLRIVVLLLLSIIINEALWV